MVQDQSEVIKVRIRTVTVDGVRSIADREYRSLAKQVQLILDEWLYNQESDGE
jgi:hypothetical protein